MSETNIIITWDISCDNKLKDTLKKKHEVLKCPVIPLPGTPLETDNLINFDLFKLDKEPNAYENHDKIALSLASGIVNLSELQFLTYKSFNLLLVVEFWLRNYFGRALQLIEDFNEIKSAFPDAQKWYVINTTAKQDSWIAKAAESLPYILLQKYAEEYDINVCRIDVPKEERKQKESKSLLRKLSLSKIFIVGRNIGTAIFKKIYQRGEKFIKAIKENLLGITAKKVLLIDKWKNVEEIFESEDRLVPVKPNYNSISKRGVDKLLAINLEWHEKKNKIKQILEKWDYPYKLFSEAIIDFISTFILDEAVSKIRQIESLDNQIKNEIDVVLLRIDSRDEYRIAALLGKKHNIPSLVLQHGIIGHPDTGYGFSPIYAQKFAGMGDYDKMILKKLGEPEHKVVVTGNPKLSRTFFLEKDNTNKNSIRGQNLKILFTTATVRTKVRRTFGNAHLTSRDLQKQFRLLKESLSDLDSVDDLVIKLHPGDYKSEAHIHMAQDVFGQSCTITKEGDIVELINESDVLITVASTTALEAMACGTPVIVIGNKIEKNYYQKMIEDEAVLYAEDSKQLESHLEYLGIKENWRKQSQKAKRYLEYNYALDGKGIERVRNLIIDLANKEV